TRPATRSLHDALPIWFGMPGERERSLSQSLDRITGQPTIHLYSYYDAAVKRNPLALVYSRDNSHPSHQGVEAMAEALERLVIETDRKSTRLNSSHDQN